MSSSGAISREELDYVRELVREWNAERLDMFAITQPNEKFDFSGVMRFYFQDAGSKVVTKCIRVSSKTRVEDLIDTLVEKFCPDMKMLSTPNYELYEVHPNEEARKLARDDKPLIVQLYWQEDDREGRFLLKNADVSVVSTFFNNIKEESQLKNKPRRDKKDAKKKHKDVSVTSPTSAGVGDHPVSPGKGSKEAILANQLYNEVPESNFTRSISNPDSVVKKRRQLKVEKQLGASTSAVADKNPAVTGFVNVLAPTLDPKSPSRSVVATMESTTLDVIRAALDKFDAGSTEPSSFTLSMAVFDSDGKPLSGFKERSIIERDCPLAIANSFPKDRGVIQFYLNRKEGTAQAKNSSPCPFLTEVRSTNDGRPSLIIEILPGITVIGNNPKNSSQTGQFVSVAGTTILPSHCSVQFSDETVSITPAHLEADVRIDGKRVLETTVLSSGQTLLLGRMHTFIYTDPRQSRKAVQKPAVSASVPNVASASAAAVPVKGLASPQLMSTISTSSPEINSCSTVTEFLPTSDAQQRQSSSSTRLLSVSEYDGELLPLTLDLKDIGGLDAFLASTISEVYCSRVQFKLAPAYTLYLTARYFHSRHEPSLPLSRRAHLINSISKKMANMIMTTIMDYKMIPGNVAFWMANASELEHFLQSDADLGPVTMTAQNLLATSVQNSFSYLVERMQKELDLALPSFLDSDSAVDLIPGELEHILTDPSPEIASSSELFDWSESDRVFPVSVDSFREGLILPVDNWVSPASRIRQQGHARVADVIHLFSSVMLLMRRCRVNAALTIQLFSQLFHHTNTWLLNHLLQQVGLYSDKSWGQRLHSRLVAIDSWAESQGLELAADCHLASINQATFLLETFKPSLDDLANVVLDCSKLNSLQIDSLLAAYRPSPGEVRLDRDTIKELVLLASRQNDPRLAEEEGRDEAIQLFRSFEKTLPFLLPEDGYSSDVMKGTPTGLAEFLDPLIVVGLCKLNMVPQASGAWTVYMIEQHQEFSPGDYVASLPRPGSSTSSSSSPSVWSENNHASDAACKEAESPSIPAQPAQIFETQISTVQQSQVPHSSSDFPANKVSSTPSPAPSNQGSLSEENIVENIVINKGNNSLGLSIIAAKGQASKQLGIYIKHIVTGGVADRDGRLKSGDQILNVNGDSLLAVSRERAVEILAAAGTVLNLQVLRNGALLHGLAMLFKQNQESSPQLSRANSSPGFAQTQESGEVVLRKKAPVDMTGPPPERIQSEIILSPARIFVEPTEGSDQAQQVTSQEPKLLPTQPVFKPSPQNSMDTGLVQPMPWIPPNIQPNMFAPEPASATIRTPEFNHGQQAPALNEISTPSLKVKKPPPPVPAVKPLFSANPIHKATPAPVMDVHQSGPPPNQRSYGDTQLIPGQNQTAPYGSMPSLAGQVDGVYGVPAKPNHIYSGYQASTSGNVLRSIASEPDISMAGFPLPTSSNDRFLDGPRKPTHAPPPLAPRPKPNPVPTYSPANDSTPWNSMAPPSSVRIASNVPVSQQATGNAPPAMVTRSAMPAPAEDNDFPPPPRPPPPRSYSVATPTFTSSKLPERTFQFPE